MIDYLSVSVGVSWCILVYLVISGLQEFRELMGRDPGPQDSNKLEEMRLSVANTSGVPASLIPDAFIR